MSDGALAAATCDHAGGHQQTQQRKIKQGEHAKTGGHHEQQDSHDHGRTDIFEQVTATQPVVPLPVTTLGRESCARGSRRGGAVGGGLYPRNGLGSRHVVALSRFLGRGRRSSRPDHENAFRCGLRARRAGTEPEPQ